MNARLSRVHGSPSVAVKQKLDYPVIDTDVHTNDYSPDLEDYVAHQGGAKPVDALRKGTEDRALRGGVGNGKSWYEQTAEECQYYRTIRSPWWARVTKNTLDVATYHLPELLYERQEEQGSDYSVLFPNNVLAPLAARDKDVRVALQRAVNHYHADLYRKYADRLTPVAGIALNTPEEGIEQLEHAVKTLVLKSHGLTGVQARHYDGHDYMPEKRMALEVLLREVCHSDSTLRTRVPKPSRTVDDGVGSSSAP